MLQVMWSKQMNSWHVSETGSSEDLYLQYVTGPSVTFMSPTTGIIANKQQFHMHRVNDWSGLEATHNRWRRDITVSSLGVTNYQTMSQHLVSYQTLPITWHSDSKLDNILGQMTLTRLHRAHLTQNVFHLFDIQHYQQTVTHQAVTTNNDVSLCIIVLWVAVSTLKTAVFVSIGILWRKHIH